MARKLNYRMTDEAFRAAYLDERRRLRAAAAAFDKAKAPAPKARQKINEAMDRFVPWDMEANARGIV